MPAAATNSPRGRFRIHDRVKSQENRAERAVTNERTLKEPLPLNRSPVSSAIASSRERSEILGISTCLQNLRRRSSRPTEQPEAPLPHGMIHAAMSHAKGTLLNETKGQGLMEDLGSGMRKIGDMKKLAYSFQAPHLELRFVIHDLEGKPRPKLHQPPRFTHSCVLSGGRLVSTILIIRWARRGGWKIYARLPSDRATRPVELVLRECSPSARLFLR